MILLYQYLYQTSFAQLSLFINFSNEYWMSFVLFIKNYRYSINVCFRGKKLMKSWLIVMLMLQKSHHGRSYLKANRLYWDWCQNWALVQRRGWICCAFWEFWSRSVVWCSTVLGTWSPSHCCGWCTCHSTKYIQCYHTMITIKKL